MHRFEAVVVENDNPSDCEISMAISPALRVTGMVEDRRHVGRQVIEEYADRNGDISAEWRASNLLWVTGPADRMQEVADTIDNIVAVHRYEKCPVPARLR